MLMQNRTVRLYLGGSFDPVHIGHLQLVHHLQNQIAADYSYFLPYSASSYKTPYLSASVRVALLQIATNQSSIYSDILIDERELVMQRVTYTVDTVRTLRQQYVHDSIIFVMGWDAFQSIHCWKEWHKIIDMVNLVVVPRLPFCSQLDSVVDNFFKSRWCDVSALRSYMSGKIARLDVPIPTVSSSQVRDWIEQGERTMLQKYVPSAVLHYLEENVYGTSVST